MSSCSSSSDDDDNGSARHDIHSHAARTTAHWSRLHASQSPFEPGAIDTAQQQQQQQQADEDPTNRVYRPLLFQSKGYASSELFRDTYEMRTRMQERQAAVASSPSSALLRGAAHSNKRTNRHMTKPRIRLETLSSRAATTVLWITYLSFALAFAMPYLQSQGFLGSVVTLPGGLCEHRIHPHEPCIFVDKKRDIARWSGFVNNVSRLAGSIELSLAITDVLNATASLARVDSEDNDDEASVLQRMDALWQQWRASESDSANASATALSVLDASFALTYDVYLYGIDVDTVPSTKRELAAETNQSVWVTCPGTTCNRAMLLDVSQDLAVRVRLSSSARVSELLR